MAAKKEESPLFVGISNGNEVRRSVLECSKGILESLKEHESFKNVREEKIALVRKFKGEVKEISKLMGSLKGYLPTIKEVKVKKPEIKVEKVKMVKIEKPKAETEVERLEKELDDIEEKLGSLS